MNGCDFVPSLSTLKSAALTITVIAILSSHSTSAQTAQKLTAFLDLDQLDGPDCSHSLPGQFGAEITIDDDQVKETQFADLGLHIFGPRTVSAPDLHALNQILETWDLTADPTTQSPVGFYCGYRVGFSLPNGKSGHFEWPDSDTSIPASVARFQKWMLAQRAILHNSTTAK